MLLNLVTNSIDSMPDGGRIILSTSLVPATDLPDVLPDLASGNYVCLKVKDTGAGMDFADPGTYVFEPFYTTKDRGRTVPALTGLWFTD